MQQLSKFYFFLLVLILFAGLPSDAFAQECAGLSNRYQQAVVSLTVESENIETGVIGTASGTGFVISATGFVLTANHVVTAPDGYRIRSISGALGDYNGQQLALRFVAKDPYDKDLALLQFKNESVKYEHIPLGDPRNVRRDQRLCSLSFSYPMNINLHSASGIYSANREDRWLTDMPSNNGESGAPVFNAATGRAVALKYGTVTGPVRGDGLNLVTPLHFAKTIIEDFVNVPMSDPLFITAMNITYITGGNSKEPSVEVATTLQLNDTEVGRIPERVGFGDRWKTNKSVTKPINLSQAISLEQCSELKLLVNKTGMYQWDVRFRVDGKLSDGRNIRLLETTSDYKLGDGDNFDPAEATLSCSAM